MKQSLLWKASKKGAKDSFIFGTMHVKSKKVFTRIVQIESIFEHIDTFVAEYNLDEVNFVQQPSDLLIPKGKSIRETLGEKKFFKIRKIIEKAFAIDISQYEYYLPLLLVNVIGEAILSKDYHLPLDLHLWDLAKKKGISLDGVEDYKSQMDIMAKIKINDQIKMLKDIAKNPTKYRKSILKMASWYEEEKIIVLYKKGKVSLGKYKNILLKRRNYIMRSRFEELASNQSIFMAIGAGHLGGKDGLLKLLKDKSWKLKAQ